MGRTSHGDSHQQHWLGAARNSAYIQQRTTTPFPSWGLQLYSFYPFPIIVGQLERNHTGRKGRTGKM